MTYPIQGFGPKRAKYHNQKITVDGITFDSKAEARRYRELQAMQQAGAIRWFSRQPSFLLPGAIRYRPDFLVCDRDGRIYAEDVKGMETPEFKLKKKLWDATFPGFPLVIVK